MTSLAESSVASAQTATRLFEHVEDIALPSAPGSQEPSLVAFEDRLYLSWMQPDRDQTSVMMAIGDGRMWSQPRLVHRSSDLFVNWADHPGIAVFPGGTVAVHWLREVGPSSFDYQIEIALSDDFGASWTEPLIPHVDRSLAQHGFVSMLPVDPDAMTVIWLDGRAYGAKNNDASAMPDAMQLRATRLMSDGRLGPDVAVDLKTCSCCQTSLAATDSGVVLAAYRDRTEGEIRDISVARFVDGRWQEPIRVHNDGWELAGCPVNGPAISAAGEKAAVAWFTAAEDTAAVKLAFSEDAGRSFSGTVRVDLGNPVGRVDLEILEDGSALVSWVEWADGDEALMICRARPSVGCTAIDILATSVAGTSVNFPKMARVGHDIYLAWTQPTGTEDGLAMRRGTLAERD